LKRLNQRDVAWIRRRLPGIVREFMEKTGAILGGGFIRACVAGETPADIDIFCPSAETAFEWANEFMVMLGDSEHHGAARRIETPNAITILGCHLPVQFIRRWTFANAEQLVKSFDFTIACAAVWVDKIDDGPTVPRKTWLSCCDGDFYADLAAKRLVYLRPVRNEDAGGSILRLLKFYQRGYRAPLDTIGGVIARLSMAVDHERLRGDQKEADLARVLTGLLVEVDPTAAEFLGTQAFMPTEEQDINGDE